MQALLLLQRLPRQRQALQLGGSDPASMAQAARAGAAAEVRIRGRNRTATTGPDGRWRLTGRLDATRSETRLTPPVP